MSFLFACCGGRREGDEAKSRDVSGNENKKNTGEGWSSASPDAEHLRANSVPPSPAPKLKSLSWSDVNAATGRFSQAHLIGEGGFGLVYWGELAVSRTEKRKVAVKRMKRNSDFGFEEFLREVRILASLTHPNIVEMVGFCNQRREAIIIYEFMEGGSLLDALKNSKDGSLVLSWAMRRKIVMGVVDALAFLHSKRIIHRDMKPSNVLLSKDFVPKISDMGLAKSCGEKTFQETIASRVVGSYVYMDPLYLKMGTLNQKSDVYSLGVMLLEILSGQIAGESERQDSFVHGILGNIQNPGTDFPKIIDPALQGAFDTNEVKVLLTIARRCVLDLRGDRPDMESLSGHVRSVFSKSQH